LKSVVVKRFAILLTIVVVGILLPCYTSGLFGNTRARVRLDHSIEPPPSITEIECAFPYSTTQWADSGAESTFEISRGDLPGLLAQCKDFRESPADPPDWATMRRNLHPSWRTGKPIAVYDGKSSEGNKTLVEVWPVDIRSVGIDIYTVWN
jgi:hypothetical protein